MHQLKANIGAVVFRYCYPKRVHSHRLLRWLNPIYRVVWFLTPTWKNLVLLDAASDYFQEVVREEKELYGEVVINLHSYRSRAALMRDIEACETEPRPSLWARLLKLLREKFGRTRVEAPVAGQANQVDDKFDDVFVNEEEWLKSVRNRKGD